VLQRTTLPIAGDLGHDKTGEALAQRGSIEIHARCRARCQVAYEHIGAREQILEQGSPLGLLQLQGNRFFTVVQPDEVCGEAAHGAVV